MCGEGGLRTWEMRAWLLLTLLFRMIPGFLLTRSAHECATSTDRPWHTRAPVEPTHSGEARLIRETTTHWTTTALDAEVDRSRCGVRPISASGGAGRSVIGRHSGAAVTGAPPRNPGESLRSSTGRATSRARGAAGRRRAPPPPRRSCRPGAWPRRRRPADRPGRRRPG